MTTKMYVKAILLLCFAFTLSAARFIISNPHRVGITDGSNATDGSAPYQVGLLINGTFQCGGSFVVNHYTVVTAAHCTYGFQNHPEEFVVRYDTLDIDHGVDLQVSKVIPHPLWNPSTIDYDIAVLHLRSAFKSDINAAIIPMATAEPAAGAAANVTGWGMTASGSWAKHLQIADSMRILGHDDCVKTWKADGVTITPRMLCASSATQASCHGDSGGPMVSGGVLVGVVSFGDPECNDSIGHPGVYANMANLRKWVEANSAASV